MAALDGISFATMQVLGQHIECCVPACSGHLRNDGTYLFAAMA
jgi:hypothetical protein